MRELNNNEVSAVSGGLIFDRFGEALGKAIGSAVSSAVADSAGMLGKGIGCIFELNVIGALQNMSQGIRGIVNWATGSTENTGNTES
ncbi:hypothetical protein [Erwinia tasmaniensis]|uniref:hypothetical protein n=1 Tax=Erwinia tasmaniensis TaxID=338565 RepID=UPI003A4D9FF4